MKKVLIKLQWVIEGLSSISGVIAALCIAGAALIIAEGVIVRKIFGLSAIWQIEASIFLLIFATFVGAPFVQKHEKHINVDLVLLQLSAKTRELVIIIVSIITCLLSGILGWFAWPMWWEAVVRNDHSMSLWSPPLWIPYFFVPFGMSLLFFLYIIYIAKKITSLRKSEMDEETAEV
jgi:TRAP-type C4-dicarboxylate transport system permease small subunit